MKKLIHNNTLNNLIPVEAIQERDIDLLILEELNSNPDFIDWILTKTIGLPETYTFIGAWHSLTQTGLGESDLAFKIHTGKRTVVFLIENKIDTGFQPDQAFRYRQRGQRGKENGEYDIFYTMLIAPKRYLSHNNEFDFYIEYEEMKDWFLAQADLGKRANYKAEVLKIAIEKLRRGYRPIIDDNATQFWWSYYYYAQKNYPHLNMRKPPKGIPKGSGFIVFLPADIGLRKGDMLIHKTVGRKGARVDLQFKGMGNRIEELKEKYGNLLTGDMKIEKANKAACIRLYVDTVNTAGNFDEQLNAVRKALEYANDLYYWAKKHSSVFTKFD